MKLTRRDLAAGLATGLVSAALLRAQEEKVSAPATGTWREGDLFFRIVEVEGRLCAMAQCLDKTVTHAIVTAFYHQEISGTKLLRHQVCVIECINPEIYCLADPFDFPREEFAFVRVETSRTAKKYEFR